MSEVAAEHEVCGSLITATRTTRPLYLAHKYYLLYKLVVARGDHVGNRRGYWLNQVHEGVTTVAVILKREESPIACST